MGRPFAVDTLRDNCWAAAPPLLLVLLPAVSLRRAAARSRALTAASVRCLRASASAALRSWMACLSASSFLAFAAAARSCRSFRACATRSRDSALAFSRASRASRFAAAAFSFAASAASFWAGDCSAPPPAEVPRPPPPPLPPPSPPLPPLLRLPLPAPPPPPAFHACRDPRRLCPPMIRVRVLVARRLPCLLGQRWGSLALPDRASPLCRRSGHYCRGTTVPEASSVLQLASV